ncbi:uncharacterized protein LOC125381038 [Haliotis rufescens]|uniref:uncharacterized protein LOC124120552 n=1 Tax=Haliotis rufescens TaxID=6454 RepID=UPI00201F258B|nr:uncharacterized protein LOC124120552 [Haliotis rufescens]XP_048253087.1 uncharacterized protein LOC125381038 [Haliotis rufescens]
MRAKHGAQHAYGKNKRRRASQLKEARSKCGVRVTTRVDSAIDPVSDSDSFDVLDTSESSGDHAVEEKIPVGDNEDGDSKTHKAINDLQPYGPDISIDKEDCVNHAHKRMGTALLKLSKELRLGGRGKGKLTKDKALKFQYYYRFAITNNVGNIDGTRNAIWASLFHCMSTDDSPHHTRCPTGPSSWCFYNRALANDLEPPAHADNIRHFLDAEIAEKMVPVYQRMSDENLLKRMVKGKTQNANECLHSVIWSRCPKTVFVGARRLHRAVASAIASFNEGTCHITQVMNKLAIEANEITAASVERLDNVRTLKARKQSQETSKMERSEKWEAKKRDRVHVEAAEGLLYGAGEF